jgi:type II secretory pathway component PulF
MTFLTPPIFVWALSCIFVFPKLKQIWRDAGFLDSTMMAFMQTSDFFMQHGVVMTLGVFVVLFLVEWRSGGWWPRYRRASVGALVFLLNSAVLVLIAAMLCSAMIAAPALVRTR